MYTINYQHLQLGAIMEQQSLFLRVSISNRLEYDLDVVYDCQNDKMLFTWQEGTKIIYHSFLAFLLILLVILRVN